MFLISRNHFFRFFPVLVLCVLRTSLCFAVENPLFGYTHLLPSPFTLHAGRFMIGTTAGVGVTDFLEIDTNLVADVFQIYNGKVRVSLLDFPGFAAGVFLGYQNVNLNNLSVYNPSINISSWMPGGVVGAEILPNFAWFVGGNFFISDAKIPTGIDTSGLLQGAEVESDFSWAYHPNKEKTGNVISAGVTYNTTFDFYGVGATHHWKNFSLGLHYYPNAKNTKVLPIISGGAVIDI